MTKEQEQAIKNLTEIIELSKEELENNNENVTAILDMVDLKSLETVLNTIQDLDKENNDLRRLYKRTATKLRENGKEDLALYFLAQIDETPTFTINDDIDYYAEYYKLKTEIEKKDKQLQEKENRIRRKDIEAQKYFDATIEQNKIIDLMAKKINQAYFEEQKFEKWFNKIIGVQKKMDYGYVVDILKQYFERKSEEC